MERIENSLWVERYRPKNVEDGYVGNDTLKAKLEQYIKANDIPHLLLYGPPGTGKTTAAKILKNNLDADCLFLNASDERGIDTIRDKLKNFAVTAGFKPFKIIVLDEADAITPEGQRALRNLMEAYSNKTRFILTANYVERIIGPLISRTQVYKLEPPSRKEVAKRLVEILNLEQVEYEKEAVIQLVNAYYPDIRKIIGTAQLQTTDGKLSVDVGSLVAQDFKLKILDVLTGNMSRKDKVNQIRKDIADAQINDFAEMYSLLFQNVEMYAPDTIAETIGALNEGQYRDGQVPDRELNFVATLYAMLN